MRARVIPTLLLQGKRLIKTRKFAAPVYIGDPINAVKLYNDKEVDELVFFDVEKSVKREEPDYAFIEQLCSEAFMPICYGGGVKTVAQMRRLFNLGVEKVSLSSALFENPELVREASDTFGAQSVVTTIHTKTGFFKKNSIYNVARRQSVPGNVIDFIKTAERLGAGEIILYSVDRDGEMMGYDLDTIRTVAPQLNIPLIGCGGAGEWGDLKSVIDAGAAAAAAGSLFVFKGPLRGILINFPTQNELRVILQ